jgi:hypothetical protein
MSALAPVPRVEYVRLRRAVRVTAVFLIAVVTQGAARPDYDAWHQSISALSLGTGGWIQDLLFLVLGTALVSTAPSWRRILRGGIGQWSYPVLMAFTGASLIAAAWWPQDPAPGYDPEQLGRALPTATGLLHLTAAGIGAFSSIAAMLVMAARFARLDGWEAWARPTRLAAGLTALSVVVYAVWSVQPTGLAGTFERLVVIVPGVWGYAVIRRLGEGAPFVMPSPSPPPA